MHTEKIDYKFEENKEKTKLFQNELETSLAENENELKFIIPTKYLETLNIDENQAPHIISNEY